MWVMDVQGAGSGSNMPVYASAHALQLLSDLFDPGEELRRPLRQSSGETRRNTTHSLTISEEEFDDFAVTLEIG